MNRTLGVGFLGAGPVTQAIHLPTLAMLPEKFHVAGVMDVSEQVAAGVAARVGARPTTSEEELLADPDVDVVVIGSPHAFHAAQVEAACRAGKRAVLCEKPLAVSLEEAEHLARVSAETGVPIIVGTMHSFDPGWAELAEQWADSPEEVHTVRSTIVMPANPKTEDKATDIIGRPPGRPEQAWNAQRQISQVVGGVMGLAIHNLPHVRRFVPVVESVDFAAAIEPWGYVITLSGGGKSAQLVGYIHDQWRLDWTLEAISDDRVLKLDFPPSYVHVGSAKAELLAAGSTAVTDRKPGNGYLAEWQYIADVAEEKQPAPDLQTLVDDLGYAVNIADLARAYMEERAA